MTRSEKRDFDDHEIPKDWWRGKGGEKQTESKKRDVDDHEISEGREGGEEQQATEERERTPYVTEEHASDESEEDSEDGVTEVGRSRGEEGGRERGEEGEARLSSRAETCVSQKSVSLWCKKESEEVFDDDCLLQGER